MGYDPATDLFNFGYEPRQNIQKNIKSKGYELAMLAKTSIKSTL